MRCAAHLKRRYTEHEGHDALNLRTIAETGLIHWYVFFSCFSFLLGACIGSFLNVCIYRIPIEQSIVKPRSHCPHCEKMIPWFSNIPLVSYIVLRARCAECGGKISARYFLVELLVAVLFLLVWFKLAFFGARPLLGLDPVYNWALIPVFWLVVYGLVLGTFVDFEHFIIPDRVTLGGIVAGLLISVALPELHATDSVLVSLLRACFGLAVGWGSLWLISVLGRIAFKKDAMGFGDVKLMGAIGAFFGWRAVLFTLIVSSFVGAISGVTMVAVGKREMQSRIPFGPYISLAALLWMLWGGGWWNAYIDLMTPDYSTGPYMP